MIGWAFRARRYRVSNSLIAAIAGIATATVQMPASGQSDDLSAECMAAWREPGGEELHRACMEVLRTLERPARTPRAAQDIAGCERLQRQSKPTIKTAPKVLSDLAQRSSLEALRAGAFTLLPPEVLADEAVLTRERDFDRLCRFAHPFAEKPACVDAFTAFRSAVEGDSQDADDALRVMLNTKQGRACMQDAPLPITDSGWVYLTVKGYAGDRITVFQARAGDGPEAVPARVFTVGRPLFEQDGLQLSVTAVPRRTELLLRVENPSRRRQDPWSFFPVDAGSTNDDHLVNTRDVPKGCIRVAVDERAGTRILLDGHQLHVARDARTYERNDLYVQPGAHRMTVLQPLETDGFYVWKDESINVGAGEDCALFEYDASGERDALVGLLPFQIDSECARGGVDEVKLHKRVVGFFDERKAALRASGKAFRDYSDVNVLATGVYDIERWKRLLPGEATGRSKGGHDNMAAFSSRLEEMKRRGVSSLVMVSLHCSQTDGGWDYSVVARRMDLEEEESTQARASVRENPRSRSQVVTAPEELYDGVVAPLARAMDLPYVRFVAPFGRLSLLDEVAVSIEIYDAESEADATADAPAHDPGRGKRPKPDVVLRAYELSGSQRRLCRDLAASNELRGPRPILKGVGSNPQTWRRETDSENGANGDHRRSVLRRTEIAGDPSYAGMYLIKAAAPGVYGGAAAYRCVDVQANEAEIFVGVHSVIGSLYNRGESERPETYQQNLMLIGLGMRIGISGVVGFAVTNRRGLTPPTWDALTPELRPDPRGLIDYTVFERSLLAGVAFTFQDQIFCRVGDLFFDRCSRFWRRIGIQVRWATLINLNMLDVSGVEPGIFPSDALDSNVEFSLGQLVQAGMHLRLAQDHSVRLFTNLYVPKLFDMTGAFGLGTRTDPGFDGRLLYGIGFEYAYAL